MTSGISQLFRLNLIILKCLGFYSTKNQLKKWKIFTKAIFYCCTVPVPILASVHLLVDKNVTFAEVSDSSFLIFQMGCFVFKGMILFHKNEKIEQSTFLLDNLHFVHIKNEHIKCIDECGKVCKILTCIFLGFCMSSFIAFVSTPIFSGNTFPMAIWLPFEPTRNVLLHIGIYVMIALGKFIADCRSEDKGFPQLCMEFIRFAFVGR